MYLAFYDDNNSNYFELSYIKDRDRKTIEEALEVIGDKHYHEFFVTDDLDVYNIEEIYDKYEEDERFFNEDGEFDLDIFREKVDEIEIDRFGYVEIYDSDFLEIEGEIQ